MKKVIRIVVGVAALAAVVIWTVMIMSVNDWRAPMAGMGDNAGTSESGGEQLFDILFVGTIWLLLVSPYLCVAAGAFNLITGKLLRVAYGYALATMALITLIELATMQRNFEFMALGNVVGGGLWVWSFRRNTPEKSDASSV